ncbi:hypothetical protein N665_0139s0075 [Sinapis alba]|nr:hypothetical protein N665_0139s0071 [Sinapis alba]KAF8106486.1 hypothetical protein N665_0139s0075 [Sinapis alba]
MNDPAPPLIPAVFFEDELDLKEEELLSAACRLIKKFPQLNGDHDGNITGRILGILDANVFLAACSSHKQRADESSEETRNRAQEAHVLWSNVVNASFVLVEPGEFDVPFKPYAIDALEELKDELGLLLYRHIRKGFREVRVSVKYEIQLKPWNHEEGKEANLDYLLTSLEQQLR